MRRFCMMMGIILITLINSMLISGCRSGRNCPITSLLLEKSEFPPGATADSISSPLSEKPKESAARDYWSGTPAYHYVGRYPSLILSKENYREIDERTFNTGKHDGPWVTPEELTYISPIADEYHVACGMAGAWYQCRMFGRYGEYHVLFWAYISDQGITIQTFESLLQAIDTKMVQCLSEKK